MQIAPASSYAPLRPAVDRSQAPTAPVLAPSAMPPVFDFPGIAAGDTFDIMPGSKAGPFSVRGEATIDRLDPDHATFHIVGGTFGFRVDVVVDVVQLDDTHVQISSHGTGIPDASDVGVILESRTNHALFAQQSDPSKRTQIDHDGTGGIVIDAAIPALGVAHLVLARRGR